MSDQTARNIVLGCLLIIVFLIVSNMDAEAESIEQSLYCENVKAGLWPDYRFAYQEVCEKE